MATKVYSLKDTEEFLSKMFGILDSLEYDRFEEVFSNDLEHNSGLQKDQGLDQFIENLKQQMQMMPPMRMKHSCDRIDVVHDGLVYASGHTEVVFASDPNSSIVIPVMGVFSRVPNGPESGKISVMTIYEDHVPFMQKVQTMMNG
ncbi:hypothetical protein N431DRAFT_445955 [Stipitochalara longipes BDJ]|nr:hypothetical protein N431DRAFT_445955 [Stipitochalara longipes BDJ]